MSASPPANTQPPSVLSDMEIKRRSVLEFLATWQHDEYHNSLKTKTMCVCMKNDATVNSLHSMIRDNQTLFDPAFLNFIKKL